jgi:hypothetical protein
MCPFTILFKTISEARARELLEGRRNNSKSDLVRLAANAKKQRRIESIIPESECVCNVRWLIDGVFEHGIVTGGYDGEACAERGNLWKQHRCKPSCRPTLSCASSGWPIWRRLAYSLKTSTDLRPNVDTYRFNTSMRASSLSI